MSTNLIEYNENLTVSYILSVFSCRANGFPFYLGFILPFLAIYVFNWIVFIVILVSLVRHAAKVAKQRFIRSNVTIAAGLALVLGLGWGFGLAASSNKINDLACALQIIFSIFVGSQGLLLLLFHGVRNKDAKKVWRSWLPFVKSGRGMKTKACGVTTRTEDKGQFTSTLQDISPSTALSESVCEPESSIAKEQKLVDVSHCMAIGGSTFVDAMEKPQFIENKSGTVVMIEKDVYLVEKCTIAAESGIESL